MKKSEYPRLCGGTFFVLLLQAVKQRTKARDRHKGGTDGLNEKDMLIGLIRIAQPEYINPALTTFKQNTSAYKSCDISKGIYLPVNEQFYQNCGLILWECKNAKTFQASWLGKLKDEIATEKAQMGVIVFNPTDGGGDDFKQLADNIWLVKPRYVNLVRAQALEPRQSAI